MQETTKDERMWGMLSHLAALGVFVFPAFGNIIGPLIIWLIKKDQSWFVDDQGKESLNFQISMTIYLFVASATICIGIGLIVLPVLFIAGVVFSIIAALKANEGVIYRYPLTLRLVK